MNGSTIFSTGADSNSAFPKYFSGGITVTTKDGGKFTHMEPINRGAGERALSEDEIVAKFIDNAALSVARDRAEGLRDLILGCERYNGCELARALCQA